MLVLLVFILIQIHSVQTFAARKTAIYLSKKLNTRVEIGSMDIQFFKTLVMDEVFIEDLHHDTLFYSKKLKVHFDKMDFKQHILHFGNISFVNTNAKLIKYKKEEDFNYQFLIDAFKSKDTTQKNNADWDIKFGGVTFVNMAFVYRRESDTAKTTGVNYSDLSTTSINGQISDIKFIKDTILGTIDYLSTKEKSGFILKNLSSYVKVCSSGIQMDELKIITPSSNIATDLTFKYNRWRDWLDYINKVSMKGDFNKSIVEMADIAYFAPALKGIQRKLIVTGKIEGTVDKLRGKDMNLALGGITQFVGDVSLTGLPNIDETVFYFNIKNFRTNYTDLIQLPVPPFNSHKTLNVSPSFSKLGDMKFKGTFTGLYNDFYAYGNFSSALGKLSSDLSMRHDTIRKKEFYKGKLKSTAFDFGKFFNINKLGKATANLDINGSGFTLEDVNATLKGDVNSIEINNYNYQNLAVEGNVANKIFNGKLKVADENVDLDFTGTVDFTHKLPHLDFNAKLNKTDLAALHFIKSTKKTSLATKIVVDITGNNIDNLNGRINFDSTTYTQEKELYKLSYFDLTSKEEQGIKTIKLQSDFLDAKIKGTFKVLDLPVSVMNLLSNYLPSYFKNSIKTKPIPPQNFEYKLAFKKTDDVTRLFLPDITIGPKTIIQGNFNSAINQLVLKGNSDKLSVNGFQIKDWYLDAKTNGAMDFNTGCKRLYTTDSSWLTDFNINTKTHLDSVTLALTWDNKTINQYKGDIKAFLYIDPRRIIKFKILPSQFVVSDSAWTINRDNQVLIDSSFINVNDVTFEHGNQSFSLNGSISDNKSDQIKLLLNNFNLANINLFTKNSDVTFKGTINGESSITDFYHGLVLTSNNTFKSVFLNNNEIGDGNISSKWDGAKESLSLNGSFTLGEIPNLLFSGNYYPKKQEENIDLTFSLQKLNMQLFEPFVKVYCSDFKGSFDGNVKLNGSIKKPLLKGTVNVNAKKITVDYLNTSYSCTHEVTVTNNSFTVVDMTVDDIYGNTAVVNGKLTHDNFKDFKLDFDIKTDKFMCLNTTEQNNNLYYGKAFVTGNVNISGYLDNINIDANVKTEKITPIDKGDKLNLLKKTELTKLFIPLTKNSELTENNFITYIKKDNTVKVKDNYKVSLGGLTLNFNLDVTPDAEVQLIFDQKVGDIIKAKGSGDINLKINSKGDFKMYGEYVIESGDYLFTLQNIINKKFDLENGGTIRWSGVPYKADMNLSAIYKARASLAPFFDSTSHVDTKKRYPVDLKLLLNGDLLSPEINFDIGLPTVDATTQQTVLSYINTDAERNRQVFSLLILGSFVTPYQIAGAGAGNVMDQTALGAGMSTSELLSNQLSNLLSQVSKNFDVGINYRPGDAISKEELGVALSTQFFNDKLTIDGNVSNSQNASSQSTNLIGDVNAEYKLTKDGKVRVKAYNKANDISSTQTYASGPYTQGVGIFYRDEFDFIGDLFLRYLNAVTPKKKKTIEGDKANPSDKKK